MNSHLILALDNTEVNPSAKQATTIKGSLVFKIEASEYPKELDALEEPNISPNALSFSDKKLAIVLATSLPVQ